MKKTDEAEAVIIETGKITKGSIVDLPTVPSKKMDAETGRRLLERLRKLREKQKTS